MQTVFERHVYYAEDLRFGHSFADFVRSEEARPKNRLGQWVRRSKTGFLSRRLVVDLSKLHETKADKES